MMTEKKSNSSTHSEEDDKKARTDKLYPVERFINLQTLVVFSTLLSITFQSARLYSISPPLTSYIGLGDALMKIGVAMPLAGISLFAIADIFEDNSERHSKGEPFEDSKGAIANKFLTFAALILLAIIAGIALYRLPVPNITMVDLRPYTNSAFRLFVMVIIARLFIRVLWQVSRVRHNAEKSGKISDRDLMSLFLYGTMFSVVLGATAGLLGNPDYCEVKTTEAVHEAFFLAALDEVSALEIDGDVIIMRNSQIEQMNCDIPRPSD